MWFTSPTGKNLASEHDNLYHYPLGYFSIIDQHPLYKAKMLKYMKFKYGLNGNFIIANNVFIQDGYPYVI